MRRWVHWDSLRATKREVSVEINKGNGNNDNSILNAYPSVNARDECHFQVQVNDRLSWCIDPSSNTSACIAFGVNLDKS
jgi:hypothetical protein